MSADRPSERQRLAADAEGRFGVRLSSGDWLIYTRTPDGSLVPRGRVEVRQQETAKVTIVGE